MSSIPSSCIDGYGNLTMHQQVSSTSNFYNQNINSNASQRYFQNGSIAYANEWAGIPLIKSNSSSSSVGISSTSPEQQQHSRYHTKLYPTRSSNGYEFDEKSMSRLAKHTQGAPIIMSNSNRYRSNKPPKTMQSSFNHENVDSRNFNNNNNSNSGHSYVTLSKSSTPSSVVPLAESNSVEESPNYEDAGYNSNGTCLPRIIKPRKRRKKDRKPIVSTSNVEIMNPPPTQLLQQTSATASSYPFTFAPNQSSNGYLPSMTSSRNGNCGSNAFSSNATVKSENFTRTMPLNDMNLFFNCDFDSNMANPPPSSSSASSPISLSNSSLSSSSATTSSCSCRLCDPNCRIWAFPLRRSFSDNSATELDRCNDVQHIEPLSLNFKKKDVGVIGGNRVKTEPPNAGDSSLSIFDMIELNNYQNNRQQSQSFMMNRLRSESLSDSGDSGCDLLLGNLNISDEILSSTFETMSDGLTDEGLNAITQKLSEFNILPSPNSSISEKTTLDFNCNIISNNNRLFSETLNFHVNESADDDNLQVQRVNNLNLSTFSTITKSYSSCDFAGDNNNHLEMSKFDSSSSSSMASVSNCNNGSPMSPILVSRPNSNNLDFNNNNNHNPAPIVCNSMEGSKERILFECFNNMTWTRPSS